MKYLNEPVVYLQDKDFDKDGNLIAPLPKNKPVLIMIQGNFCGYCTQAKPAFQELAEKDKGSIICATIQGDGKEEGEKELGKRIGKFMKNVAGYPSYVLYKNGKYVTTHKGGRDVKSLENFVHGN